MHNPEHPGNESPGRELKRFLSRALTSGEYPPGEQLPTERDFAKRFGITRAAVRGVLVELEREGAIYRKVGRGTFIAENNNRAANSEPHWCDISPRELMEARLSMEPVIAGLFVENASARDEARVRDCLERSEASRSFEEFELWDEAFHEAIVNGAHNPLLDQWYSLVTTTRQQTRWSGIKRRVYTAEYRSEIEKQHRAIFAALCERNADKATAMTQSHLRFIQKGLFGD